MQQPTRPIRMALRCMRRHARPAAQPFLLGASAESATLAARLGWAFVYASHLNASATDLERTFDTYRDASGGRTPLLAVSAIVAGTRDAAARLASGHQGFRVQVGDTPAVNVGSLEQAHAHPPGRRRPHRIDPRETRIVHGTRDDVLHDRRIASPPRDCRIRRRHAGRRRRPRIASLRLLAGAHADDDDTAAGARDEANANARDAGARTIARQPDFEGTAP